MFSALRIGCERAISRNGGGTRDEK